MGLDVAPPPTQEQLAQALHGVVMVRITTSAPLNVGVDELPDVAQVLASGALRYFEKQGPTVESFSSECG